MEETAICSERIYAEKRSYNFQVKREKGESKYLLITEFKIDKEEKVVLQSIIIHEEDMDKFTDGLIKMLVLFQ